MRSKIYEGEIMHSRLVPIKHSFCYPYYFYAFDLDELPELAQNSVLFGYNQLRPVAIHDRDYLAPGRSGLREKLIAVFEKAGLDSSFGEVVLVTAARYFNYVFNPISFFYCYDDGGVLKHILVQVNNTFGEMHLYLLDPSSGERLKMQTEKAFHVSPFFPRQGHYEFRLTPPAETVDNIIRYYNDEDLSLVARIHGRATPLTPENLTRTLLAHPVCASLTMPRILWQAAKLYGQKRLPVYSKPVPVSTLTVRPAPPSVLDRLGLSMVLRFLSRLPQGELFLTTPDQQSQHFGCPGSTPSVDLTVREHRFFRRVMLSGDIGFGESYMAGEWISSDLPGLLGLLAKNETVMNDRSIITSTIGRLVNYLRHILRPNTVRGSSRNIREHYDLSNAFFETFLDPTMTYSCGLFKDDHETLEQAQHNKLWSIIDKAGITAADHVLEIGCGWGSFAIEAVKKTGCRVTGITVSQEQLELARQRVHQAGLQDQIDIKLCDYRHIEGKYSKVVSIEMLEAVGHAGLGPFFAACDRALPAGGQAVIQVITIPDRKYTAYRYSSDWIRKHIFPGGHLPSVGAMAKAIARHSAFDFTSLEEFGLNYAKTLSCWRQTLLSRQGEIREMGFDDSFIRKWEYYFAYCEAGFASRIIDLAQLVLTKADKS